jgi:hypothetical protein
MQVRILSAAPYPCRPSGYVTRLLSREIAGSSPAGGTLGKNSHAMEDSMPGGKRPGPSIKKPKVYEALKEKGYSKEKAAKISNAQKRKKK